MIGPRDEPSPTRKGGASSSQPRRFQLAEYRRQRLSGTLFVHARLKANRPSGWTVVGVFQMAEAEWIDLVAACEVLGIDVVSEEIEG